MHKLYFIISIIFFGSYSLNVQSFYFDINKIKTVDIAQVKRYEIQQDFLLLQKLKLPELDVILLEEVIRIKEENDRRQREELRFTVEQFGRAISICFFPAK